MDAARTATMLTECGPICRHITRDRWASGVWDHEPDRVEFRHEGLPCLLHRGRMGAWCGYVGVPQDHPWYQRKYGDCAELEPCPAPPDGGRCDHAIDCQVDVHGGLTYADACQGHLCHVPGPGESAAVWWFGFDCAHGGDLMPGYPDLAIGPHSMYRDLEYVRRQTMLLAEQLANESMDGVWDGDGGTRPADRAASRGTPGVEPDTD